MAWKDTWTRRWDALAADMDILNEEVESSAIDRKTVFLDLINALRVFGQNHFNFFLNGFTNTDPAKGPVLERDDRYSPDFVMSGVIGRITEDLRQIQSCLADRVLYASLKNPAAQEALLALENADYLAYASLAGQPHLLEGPFTVISAFHDLTTVRLIPYAPVALISVPLTSTKQVRDYLAVPHEAGHYLLHHAHNLKDPQVYDHIEASLKQFVRELEAEMSAESEIEGEIEARIRYLHAWIEELFADVYGGVVAGRAIALSSQDIERNAPYGEFISDDGEHPSPRLRPRLYASVVEQAWKDPQDTQTLNTLWESLVSERLDSPGNTLIFPVRGVMPLAETRQKAEHWANRIITEVLTRYLQIDPMANPVLQKLGGIRLPKDPEAIYEAFYQAMLTLKKDFPDIDPRFDPENWVEWAEHLVGFDVTDPQNQPILPGKWLDIFDAEGWHTETLHGGGHWGIP